MHGCSRLETLALSYAHEGVVMIEHLMTDAELRRLDAAFAPGAGQRQDAIPETVRAFVREHMALTAVASAIGGGAMRLVRIVAFDKTAEANWFVPWHQDRSVALAERREAEGFGAWTSKAGVVHAEPPVSLLEQMVTLRVHLDACGEDDGPLEVAPGTHRHGRLPRGRIDALVADAPVRLCLAERGDILVMSPLLLHRSQRARRPERRRVLHLEYCSGRLAPGLAWALAPATGDRLH
jgi:hypothetical protein